MRRRLAGSWPNNASGSSYGIRNNSYNTLRSMRIIFADGTLLDTADPASRPAFARSHPELICLSWLELPQGGYWKRSDCNRIAEKFRLKNTCGYGVQCPDRLFRSDRDTAASDDRFRKEHLALISQATFVDGSDPG
jgi:hypothetical protein